MDSLFSSSGGGGPPASASTVPQGRPWLFLLLFLGVYCILYLGYSTIPDQVLRERLYGELIVRPAERVINGVSRAEHVVAVQNQLRSSTTRFNIVRGCDGAGFYFMLIGAIVAYRQRLRATLLGILGACLLVYAVNQLRIIALYFIAAHAPTYFVPAHVYFIPVLMILASVVYFAAWSSVSARRADEPSAP